VASDETRSIGLHRPQGAWLLGLQKTEIADRAAGSGGAMSRRGFLGVAASVAGGSMLGPLNAWATDPSLRVPPGGRASRVVRIQNRYVVNGPEVHRAVFGEMLDRAMIALTRKPTAEAAWRAVLRSDDVIGLKFNRSGQDALHTTNVVADVIIASIVQAGWRAEQIVCIEAPPEVEGRNATTPAAPGYQSEATDFGSGSDNLANVLEQVTALIDIPYLKSHNITGATCCLKNLSHGLIKHPAKFHRNGCSPYIADIVALPQIRDKLRLCLVDATRVVFDKGPEPNASTISDEGLLLASADPVATDSVAATILNDVRRQNGLGPITGRGEQLGYIRDAQGVGLGVAEWAGIDLVDATP
jgi:hypothetical protein